MSSAWIVQAATPSRRQPSVSIIFCSNSRLNPSPCPHALRASMNPSSIRVDPPLRPEFEYPVSALAPAANADLVRAPRSLLQRWLHHDGFRKVLILVVLAFTWEMAGR